MITRFTRNLLTAAVAAALFVSVGCGDSPEHQIATAHLALRNNNPDKALELADKALKAQPQSVEARLLRAEAQLKLNRLDDARQSIDELLISDPNHQEARDLLISWVFVRQLDLLNKSDFLTSAAQQEQFDQSLALGGEQAQWLAAQEGQQAESHYVRARMRQHEIVRSELRLRTLNRDVAMYPAGDARGQEIQTRIGQLERERDRMMEETEALLMQAITIKPDYFVAHENLTTLLLGQTDAVAAGQAPDRPRSPRDVRQTWDKVWRISQALATQENLPAPLVGRVVLSLIRMPNDLYEEQERYATAWRIQKAAANPESNHPDFLIATGRLHLAGNEPQQARDYLAKAPASNVDAQFLLASAHISLKEYDKARNILKALTTDRRMTEVSDVWVLYARALHELGDEAGAREAASQAIGRDPNNPRAVQVHVELNRDRLSDLGQSVERYYEANRQNPVAIRQMIQYLQATARLDRVQTILDENVTLIQPMTDELLMVLVDGYFVIQAYDKAETSAQQLVGRRPNDIDAHLRLAQAMLMQGKDEQVRAMLVDLRQQFPQAASVDQLLAGLYLDRGEFDRTVELLEAIVQDAPMNHEARNLLARALIMQSLPDEAMAQVEAVLEDRPQDVMANTLAARIMEMKGQPQDADRFLARIDADEVDEVRYPLLVARSLVRSDKLDEAANLLNNAMARGVNEPMIHAVLAGIYTKQGKKAMAEHQLLYLAQRVPNSPSAYHMLARHYIQNGEIPQGLDQLRKLATLPTGNEGWSRMAQADLLLAMSPPRVDEAIKTLADHYQVLIRQTNRQVITVADALARIYMARAEPDRAMAVYDLLIQTGFMTAQAQLRQVDVQRAIGDDVKALQILDTVAPTITPEERGLRYYAMRRYADMGRIEGALALLEGWLAAEPQAALLHRWHGEMLMQAGRATEAVPVFERALAIEPQNPALHLRLASAHMANYDFVQAAKALDEMALLDTGSRLHALAAKGQMYLSIGLTEQASHTFDELERIGRARDPRVIYAIGRAFAAMGREDKAIDRLGDVPSYAPQYAPAQILIARLDQRNGRMDAARQRLEELRRNPQLAGVVARELAALNLQDRLDETLLQWADQVLAIEQMPADVRVEWLRVKVSLHAAHRNFEPLMQALRDLSDLRPDFHNVVAVRILMLLDRGLTEQAAQIYRENRPLQEASYGPLLARMLNEESPLAVPPSVLSQYLLALSQRDVASARQAAEAVEPYRTIFKSDLLAFLERSDASSVDTASGALLLGAAVVALDCGVPALADYFSELVMAKSPNFTPAYAVNVEAKLRTGKPLDTITARITRDLRGSALAIFLTARERSAQNQYPQAAEQLAQLVEREPDNVHMSYELAQALDRARDYDRAIALLERMVAAEGPYVLLASNDLAYLLAEHRPERLDEAFELAVKTRERDPGSPALRDTVGWIEHLRGDHQAALGELNRAATRLGGVSDIHYHLGVVYQALGNETWAKYHLKQAASGPADNLSVEKANQLLSRL